MVLVIIIGYFVKEAETPSPPNPVSRLGGRDPSETQVWWVTSCGSGFSPFGTAWPCFRPPSLPIRNLCSSSGRLPWLPTAPSSRTFLCVLSPMRYSLSLPPCLPRCLHPMGHSSSDTIPVGSLLLPPLWFLGTPVPLFSPLCLGLCPPSKLVP